MTAPLPCYLRTWADSLTDRPLAQTTARYAQRFEAATLFALRSIQGTAYPLSPEWHGATRALALPGPDRAQRVYGTVLGLPSAEVWGPLFPGVSARGLDIIAERVCMHTPPTLSQFKDPPKWFPSIGELGALVWLASRPARSAPPCPLCTPLTRWQAAVCSPAPCLRCALAGGGQ